MPSVLFRDLKEKLNSSFKNREFSGFMSEMRSGASEKSRKGFTFSNTSEKSRKGFTFSTASVKSLKGFTFSTASVKSLKGFTLIELLIVIAIIGILVGVVLIAVDPVSLLNSANDSKKREELLQMKITLQIYFNDTNDYPVAANINDLVTGGYTRSLPDSFADGDAIYEATPAGEYRAGVVLDNTNTDGNDGGTFTKCDLPPGSIPTGGSIWGDADYFICPD